MFKGITHTHTCGNPLLHVYLLDYKDLLCGQKSLYLQKSVMLIENPYLWVPYMCRSFPALIRYTYHMIRIYWI
jgi:hypothetical protein